jgi:hypothetical protein
MAPMACEREQDTKRCGEGTQGKGDLSVRVHWVVGPLPPAQQAAWDWLWGRLLQGETPNTALSAAETTPALREAEGK